MRRAALQQTLSYARERAVIYAPRHGRDEHADAGSHARVKTCRAAGAVRAQRCDERTR